MIHRNIFERNMLDCYDQQGAWADGSMLPKHHRELPELYEGRKRAFQSPAIYSYLIDSYDAIFAHAPTRINADELYLTHFCGNAGGGMSLNALLNRALKLSQVLGSCFLVMDSPLDQSLSYEEMIHERSFPYIEIVLPQNIVDLQLDRVGNIVRFAYRYYDNEIEYTRCYTPYKVTDTAKKADDRVYQIPVKMPVIPLISSSKPLVSGELPPSPTLSLYQMQLSLAITNSLIDEELHASAYPLLVITGAVDPEKIKLGVFNGLKLSSGDSASYLQPSSSTIDVKLKRIESLISQMIKTHANLITNSDLSQSGIAKLLDRTTGAAYLKKIAGLMEQIEYNIHIMFCEWSGMAYDVEYTVAYFKDFDSSDIIQSITAAVDMLGVDFSDETKLAIKRKLLSNYFSGDDEILVPDLIIAESQHEPTQSPIDKPFEAVTSPVDEVA